MLFDLEINHKEVKKYHDYLMRAYRNEKIEKEIRYEIAKRIEVIQNLVLIYEQGKELDIEDLSWTEMGRHLLPEEKRKLAIKLKQRLNKK